MDYENYMKLAMEQAKKAFAEGEVPIGCIIAHENGQILGTGRNMAAAKGNSLYHAEIIAINEACGKTGDWRLSHATAFVTVEPCPMCAGALLMCRIGTVVYGASNPKVGCVGSLYNLLDDSRLNHRAKIVSGVMAEECGELMTRFFREYLR